MKLFDETENKYYEMISYLLTGGETFGVSDLYSVTSRYISGEIDFDVIDSLFLRTEDEAMVFQNINGEFWPTMENDFPIRANRIEKQALKNLLRDDYTALFLADDTMEKLHRITESIPDEWDERDISIKNRFADGVAENISDNRRIVSLIARMISQKKAIIYDNIKHGKYEFRDEMAFPVRLEYSAVNDQFRVYVYLPIDDKFVKMNLNTMSNIRETDYTSDKDIMADFILFCKRFERTVTLDVEPERHIIERCFRVFSCYSRKASYNQEENKYILEIEYQAFDEAEIIRDILSFGSRVVVTGPETLRKEVYQRILAARKQYQ